MELKKGGFSWPPAYLIASNMGHFEQNTLAEFTPCRSGDLPDVSHAIAVVHAELLLIHPFRKGNGRLARWLADTMAAQAGLPLPAYGFTGRGSRTRRKHYLDAVVAGYAGRYSDLTRFFAEAILLRLEAEE